MIGVLGIYISCIQYPKSLQEVILYGRFSTLQKYYCFKLEQATVLPYLTLRLAEEGANVIRMEHPIYGDPNRRVGDDVLKEDRMFSYYLSINSGKKALTLDIGLLRAGDFKETHSKIESRYLFNESITSKLCKTRDRV